jgi:hypothetical protein
MDLHVDSNEKDDVLERLSKCDNLGDLFKLIEDVHPGWICGEIKEYSPDYQHLSRNWKIICKKVEATPKVILIVTRIGREEQDKYMSAFAEALTRSGFVVRDKKDVVVCHVCNRGLPVISLHEKMKEFGLKVPPVWSNKCTEC